MRRRSAVLALWAALLAGCGPPKTSDRNLVFIDPPDAEQLMRGERRLFGLGSETRAVWVDPRTADKFGSGHIAGAVNVPFADVSRRHHLLLDYDILVVYGEDYDDGLATAMSKTLLGLGHAEVRTLRGGLRAWTEAGHQLEAD
jgi:3-mercaptopyruvate sulfurtransferase SseA